jgi:Protein of unknown function (DUF3060)
MLKVSLITAVLALAATTALADVNIVDNKQKLTVDCAKEKGVNITGNKAEVTLNGTCEYVNISGNNATVKGSTRTANVSGNDNALTLDAVDQILVTGNKNTISYKKSAKEKKTSTANTGENNKITQGK